MISRAAEIWYKAVLSRHSVRAGGTALDEDRFNMSIRKFLKVVGVTSQRDIENAVRDAVKAGSLKGTGTIKAKVTLSLPTVNLSREIDGEIELG